MTQTIAQGKQGITTETPLLLFTCVLADGSTQRWSTHTVTVAGQDFEGRVLRHNLFTLKSLADDALDGLATLTLTLVNVDAALSQLERNIGWKGASLSAEFAFYSLESGEAASERRLLFRGVANPPDDSNERSMQLTFSNRLSLQNVQLPEVRIQRRCAWQFPNTPERRKAVVEGGLDRELEPIYRCGYSADVDGGVGNLLGGAAYQSCDLTKASCQARGMYSNDTSNRPTRRFGGLGFVPASALVRGYGESGRHVANAIENEGRYNDFVPLIYGTAWYAPPIIFGRNDGNLLRLEILLGSGEMDRVLKVIANDTEIQPGRAGANMTATGWYSIVSLGSRTGAFNLDFADGAGKPLGDPHGSLASLSLVLPNKLLDGKSLPRVQILMQGLKLAQFDESGSWLRTEYTNNSAWVLLDLLRRSGWKTEDLDLGSFARAASVCAEIVNGQPRYRCNLVLRQRRSAAELIRGVRAGAGLLLVNGNDGKLEVLVEDTLGRQQAEKPVGSNSTEALFGGWPAFEFGDGTTFASDILCKANGEPTIRLWSKRIAETPNRYQIEFQDSENDYQQDGLTLVDTDDVERSGQQVSAGLAAIGFPTFDQAGRIIRRQLEKSLRGNTFFEFETGVRGVCLRPGDIITITYAREGLLRQPIRIQKIVPSLNYQTMQIVAQIHDDVWYEESSGESGERSGRPAGLSPDAPRPITAPKLVGGKMAFEVTERPEDGGDGVILSVPFVVPEHSLAPELGRPLIDVDVQLEDGGSLEVANTYFYAVSGVTEDDREGPLSFLARVVIGASSQRRSVRITGIKLPLGAVDGRVYRGHSVDHLLRIGIVQSDEYLDLGGNAEITPPPDPQFDHLNVYWRWELLPESPCTGQGANWIESTILEQVETEMANRIVRLTVGTGAGQERAISSFGGRRLKIQPDWDLIPDSTTRFVVAEAEWKKAGQFAASPLEVVVNNHPGETVELQLRAANSRDKETNDENSPIVRWEVQTQGAGSDVDVPPAPSFGLIPASRGNIVFGAIGFSSLENTRTISAGLLRVYFWNELENPSAVSLVDGCDEQQVECRLNVTNLAVGSVCQAGQELIRIGEQGSDGAWQVERGLWQSPITAHEAGTIVYILSQKSAVLPFAPGLFGSPASGDYEYPLALPQARVAAAEISMVNRFGAGDRAGRSFTATADGGYRTGSGGQYSLQVGGPLAVDVEAALPVIVEQRRAVRQISGILGTAPAGSEVLVRILVDDQTYCELTFAEGSRISSPVNGFGLPPLAEGAKLGLAVLAVGTDYNGSPGRDLTVTLSF